MNLQLLWVSIGCFSWFFSFYLKFRAARFQCRDHGRPLWEGGLQLGIDIVRIAFSVCCGPPCFMCLLWKFFCLRVKPSVCLRERVPSQAMAACSEKGPTFPKWMGKSWSIAHAFFQRFASNNIALGLYFLLTDKFPLKLISCLQLWQVGLAYY